jgi:hypothetical protein
MNPAEESFNLENAKALSEPDDSAEREELHLKVWGPWLWKHRRTLNLDNDLALDGSDGWFLSHRDKIFKSAPEEEAGSNPSSPPGKSTSFTLSAMSTTPLTVSRSMPSAGEYATRIEELEVQIAFMSDDLETKTSTVEENKQTLLILEGTKDGLIKCNKTLLDKNMELNNEVQRWQRAARVHKGNWETGLASIALKDEKIKVLSLEVKWLKYKMSGGVDVSQVPTPLRKHVYDARFIAKVKKLGAVWGPYSGYDLERWYVPPGVHLQPFLEWLDIAM